MKDICDVTYFPCELFSYSDHPVKLTLVKVEICKAMTTAC